MSRGCSLCHHPEIEEIRRELGEGKTYGRIARRYFCTREQVRYFAEHCMSEELKNQRFKVLRRRAEDQIVRAGRRIVKNLPPALSEDLLEALEGGGKPHGPHT